MRTLCLTGERPCVTLRIAESLHLRLHALPLLPLHVVSIAGVTLDVYQLAKVCAIIHQCPSLSEITLQGMKLDSRSSLAVATAIGASRSIKVVHTVDMSNNCMGSDEIVYICWISQCARRLTRLDLHGKSVQWQWRDPIRAPLRDGSTVVAC
jgi:hypothetical protein